MLNVLRKPKQETFSRHFLNNYKVVSLQWYRVEKDMVTTCPQVVKETNNKHILRYVIAYLIRYVISLLHHEARWMVRLKQTAS